MRRTLGSSGNAALVISHGATVTSSSGQVASPMGSSGTVTVTGSGSQWIGSWSLLVGYFSDSRGTVNIGTSGAAGTLQAGEGNGGVDRAGWPDADEA